MDPSSEQTHAQKHSAGGVVEPVNRAAVAKERVQTPQVPERSRYELRDPFAEVTYHAKTFDDMVSKAEQLGATRFHAVSAQGQRTPVLKIDGVWQRPGRLDGHQREESAPDRDPEKSDVRKDTTAAPVTPAPNVPPTDSAIARIDAEAERRARTEKLEAALNERYVIKRAPVKLGDVTVGQTEYRHRGDTSRVAFTESTFKLATDTNSPSVVRSMVDVAQARNWRALRVSGHEDFKRMVWLEASLRQVKTVGYDPVPGDIALLHKEREARQVNRIEPHAEQKDTDGSANKSSRGSGGRKAVLAALEAVLVARRVPERQREAVMAAAEENLGRRLASGQQHKVKVYDRAAPKQPRVVQPTPEVKRSRERASPVR